MCPRPENRAHAVLRGFLASVSVHIFPDCANPVKRIANRDARASGYALHATTPEDRNK